MAFSGKRLSKFQSGVEQKEPRGARGARGKWEKALWKKGRAYLATKPVPVLPALPVVPASSEFNSRLGLSKSSERPMKYASTPTNG
jgi:hypothetical protein